MTRQRAFNEALLTISRRIDLLLALPVEKLTRLALQGSVNDIGGAGVPPGATPTP